MEREGFPAVGQKDEDDSDGPWPEPPVRWEATWNRFRAAQAFEGPVQGMCFRLGELGLGYYTDDPPTRERHVAELARKREFEMGETARLAYLRPRPSLPAGEADVEMNGYCEECDPPPRRRTRRGGGRRRSDGTQAGVIDRWAHVGNTEHRDAGLWAFDTMNANAAGPAANFLEHTGADVTVLQETRVAGETRLAFERRMAWKGWQLVANDANKTPAGAFSAGVAVAARAHIGHGRPAHEFDAHILRGRVKATRLAGFCRGGVHVISLYLWSG